MRAERCDELTWLAFGHVTWGSTVPPFAVMAGTTVRADRIERVRDGHRVTWLVSSPLYAEGPGEQRVIYAVHDDRLSEHSVADAAAWDVWLGAYTPEVPDGVTKAAVPEALQPASPEPYSLQRAATATTTTTRKATTMSKTTTTTTPAATADESRAKSAVSKDGEHKCAGCEKSLPAVKFPTKRTESGYERDTAECRACRDARRAAQRAAKGKTAAA